jgi:hypothetical protein
MRNGVPFEYEFRERGNVLVQDMEAWDGSPEGLDAVSREWADLARQDHITATLTVFGDDLMLGPDAQEELMEEWSGDADRVDLDGIAYVGPGIKARAVSANIDADYEIRTFDDFEAGLSWAQSR